MKKNSWECKDKNLDDLVGNVFLGHKKKRNLQKEKNQNLNGSNKTENKPKQDMKTENEKNQKTRKNSDPKEKGFKIIFTDEKEIEKDNENKKNIIQIKKRKEHQITNSDRKISLETLNIAATTNSKASKNNKKKNSQFEDREKNSLSKNSEKSERKRDFKNNENRSTGNKEKGSLKVEIKNDISNFQNAININTNEIIDTSSSGKPKKEIKPSSNHTDNLFTQDFIKLPKESKGENNLKKSDLKFKLDSGNFYPWVSKETKKFRGMIKLHQEILDFYDFIKPTTLEDKMRHKTVKVIKNLIQTEWPSWTVKEFGSFPNKIHLPDSDVDILVLTNKESNDQHKILKKITDKLVEADIVDYIQLINARVPIIKATLKETKINLDIRKNGYEAKKVIKRTLQDFPFMRPILYVLKYFLRQKKLNESYTGGISSFLLFNLLLAYVQYLSKENKFSLKTNLGNILVGFLQFYGFDFNFEDVGISVRYGGYFFKKSDCSSQGFKPNALLSVENFQELDQDIGKSAFKFRKILNCFKQARDSLYYPSKIPVESYVGQFIEVDKFLIDRYCNTNNITTK